MIVVNEGLRTQTTWGHTPIRGVIVISVSKHPEAQTPNSHSHENRIDLYFALGEV